MIVCPVCSSLPGEGPRYAHFETVQDGCRCGRLTVLHRSGDPVAASFQARTGAGLSGLHALSDGTVHAYCEDSGEGPRTVSAPCSEAAVRSLSESALAGSVLES